LLAMVVNDAACLLTKRGALESIASKLAPTESLTEQHYAFAGFFLFVDRSSKAAHKAQKFQHLRNFSQTRNLHAVFVQLVHFA